MLSNLNNPNPSAYNKRVWIVVIIICIVVLIGWLRMDSLNADFDKEGVFTEGVVVDFIKRRGKKIYYTTEYNYYVNGKLYEAESPIDVQHICKSTQRLCRGSVCKVQYLKSDPTVSRLIVD